MLWNQYFFDAVVATQSCNFEECIYADDLNAFRIFDRTASAETILGEIECCQVELHSWGKGNSILFDASKESKHILHRLHHERSNFKVLGVNFDNHLRMHEAVRELAVGAGWRLRALFRACRFFNTRQFVTRFKMQVLSYVESGSVAFFHAPVSTMLPLDRIYNRFIRWIDVSPADAIVFYRLAPLYLRRRIAALGVLHKRVLGLLAGPIAQFFPFATALNNHEPRTRMEFRRHTLQLLDRVAGNETEIFKRSLFGYVAIYNRLPQDVVEERNVFSFQRRLQNALSNCVRFSRDWETLYSVASRTTDISRFQSLFR